MVHYLVIVHPKLFKIRIIFEHQILKYAFINSPGKPTAAADKTGF
jgi:hypothetical protein